MIRAVTEPHPARATPCGTPAPLTRTAGPTRPAGPDRAAAGEGA